MYLTFGEINNNKRGFMRTKPKRMYLKKKIRKEIIKEAQKKYSEIVPCGLKKSFDECFDVLDGTVVFWFNTKDKNTHLLRYKKDENNN